MKNEIEEQEKEFETKSLTLLETAHSIKVTDEESYKVAGDFLKGVKDSQKKVKDFFSPLKDAAHKAHKAITSKESESLTPLKEADQMVRDTVGTYLDEQEKIRQEEQRKLDLAAKKQADKEKADLLKRAGNVKTESKREELLDKAEDVVEEIVHADHAVEKTTSFAGGGGITRKKDIKVEVIDAKALIAAIASGAVPTTVIEIKDNKLKAYAKAAGLKAKDIPGCIIKEVSGVAIR